MLMLWLAVFFVNAQALDFDGVNDYASASGGLSNNSNFTLEAWVKPRTFSSYNWVIQVGDVALGLSENGKLTYMVDGSTSGSVSAQSILLSNWCHIALVYNSSLGNKYTLYYNGSALAVTPQFSYEGKFPDNLSGFYFSRSSGSEGWIGGIDEVRIWSVARSAGEISANYASELANPAGQTGLAGYYKMNEGTPGGTNTGITSLIDASGNNHPATLSGFSLTGSTSNYISSQLSASCVNPTSGGTISSAQIICTGSLPASLSETVAPAGTISGTLQYKWQSSTTSAAAGFADISGATSSGYQAGVLSQDTWYKRLVKVDCESNWLESNVIEITVNPLLQYRSKADLDYTSPRNWTTAANWEQYNGSNWVAATSYPGEISNDCDNPWVTILANHHIEISNTAVVVPNLEIKSNGKLMVKNTGKISVVDQLVLEQNNTEAVLIE